MATASPDEFAGYVVSQFPPIRNWQEVEWPELLQPIVAKFGPRQVWETGYTLFGYPPTWIGGSAAALMIQSHLISTTTQKGFYNGDQSGFE